MFGLSVLGYHRKIVLHKTSYLKLVISCQWILPNTTYSQKIITSIKFSRERDREANVSLNWDSIQGRLYPVGTVSRAVNRV